MKTVLKRIPTWFFLTAFAFLGMLALVLSFTPLAKAINLSDVQGTPDIALAPFANGISNPVFITHAGDERLFVIDRAGLIRIVQPNGTVLPTPFLDISAIVLDSPNERGLLGLAFHPDYANNIFRITTP